MTSTNVFPSFCNIFAVADCVTAGLSAPAFLEPFWEAGNLSFSIPLGKSCYFWLCRLQWHQTRKWWYFNVHKAVFQCRLNLLPSWSQESIAAGGGRSRMSHYWTGWLSKENASCLKMLLHVQCSRQSWEMDEQRECRWGRQRHWRKCCFLVSIPTQIIST